MNKHEIKELQQTTDYYQQLLNEQLSFSVLHHPAVWHMEDAEHLELDCLVVKSLLLRDHRSDKNYLVLCMPDEKLKFGILAQTLHTSRSQLKFAVADELQETLHTISGMVSPLILEPNFPIVVIISQSLVNQPRLGMHAGTNTETVVLSYNSLLTHLKLLNITYQIQALNHV